MKMESSGADSRGGIDRFPEEGLVTFERRFWEEGRVRNKSMKLKRYLQVSHQQKSMFTCPKACAVRRDIRRWKRKDMTEHPRVIALPGQLTSYGSLSQTDTHTHTHTHIHTQEWIHVTMRGLSLSPTLFTYPWSSTFSPSTS